MANKRKKDIAEENARLRALAAFYDWLKGRYAAHDLTEMSGEGDNLDPISLRRLYIPLRLSEDDIEDTAMAGPEEVVAKETPENEPGRDLTELLIDNPFLVISGRPGSGKTTLVKWIVSELTGDHPSRLRRPLQGERGIAPLPIVLRELGDLSNINDLAQLLDRWWESIERQAGKRLDYERLRWLLTDLDGERFPALLMFDGIDEVGGRDIRGRLLETALRAAENRFRVVVTGRPAGLADLDLGKLSEVLGFIEKWPSLVYTHLTPLSWPRIQQFIHDWYRLRPEWRHKAELGIPNFLDALQDPNREYLLTLARRPIFLTLMAQVHTADNEMPHGRAELYSRIIDLYLERQERHRQLRNFTDGSENPAWPPSETRLVLGHLAWLSQIKGSEGEESGKADKRRVVWRREELLGEIEQLLGEGRERRFTRLGVEDSERLLNYFLHPAGLLVEPAEGEVQFAHLSFQEYLCAEYILSGLSSRRFERDLKEQLFSRLDRPGWDEVALLLLTIQEKRTQNRGHFDILHLLDPTDPHQARLLVTAVTGRELRFPDDERLRWLPLAILCALLHPDDELGDRLRTVEAWESPGLALIVKLLAAGFELEPIKMLQAKVEEDLPSGYHSEDGCVWFQAAAEVWKDGRALRRNPKRAVDFLEARFYALIALVTQTQWWQKDDALAPFTKESLESLLAEWVAAMGMPRLWMRATVGKDELPAPSDATLLLDTLIPAADRLWRVLLERMPVDAWMLQGEVAQDRIFSRDYSQFTVLNAIYPVSSLSQRSSLTLSCYQLQELVEISAMGGGFDNFSLARARLRSMLLLRHSLKSRLPSRLYLRSCLRSESQLHWRLPLRLLSRLWHGSLSPQLDSLLMEVEAEFRTDDRSEYLPEDLSIILQRFAYTYAAHDWFNEQAEDPDLMKRRGLRPGEPLPKEFNCFDESGRPLPIQKREDWLKLRQWADDFDAVLAFVFPEGLEADQRQLLLDDLKMLQRQSWAPQKALDAILESWPEDQPERDISMEHAERKLIEACEAFLAE